MTDEVEPGYVIAQTEYPAGPDHVIVVYQPPDLGSEIDPANLMGWIAADIHERAAAGLRLLSMTTMPLRHGGLWAGAQGSGYQTKVAIAVVYERWPVVPR